MYEIFCVINFLIFLLDLIFYILAVEAYGPRRNWWPLSGYYELFIRKGRPK
jgi:hypothetical protein